MTRHTKNHMLAPKPVAAILYSGLTGWMWIGWDPGLDGPAPAMVLQSVNRASCTETTVEKGRQLTFWLLEARRSVNMRLM